MKKFSLLPIGEAFEYQGERYTKSGPLTASRSDGSSRMIPRSAVVSPLSGSAPPAPAMTAKQLPVPQVLEAFEHYHKGCLEWLAMTEQVDAALAATIREAMDAARERFLAELQRLGGS
jgi:hypothetical protein